MNRSLSRILAAACVVFALSSSDAIAESVTLQWDPSPAPTVAGYDVQWGRKSGSYDHTIRLGNGTTDTVTGLEPGVQYYFAVTAYSSASLTSEFSNEVVSYFHVPSGMPALR